MVMHEEHHQPKCSSRPSSKKNKAKKIPQRGLGVAQLEKLRIEEQQKTWSSRNSVNHPPPAVILAAQQQQLTDYPFYKICNQFPFIRSAINSNSFTGGTHADISDLNIMPPIRLINSNAAYIPISPRMNLRTEPPSNQSHSANPSSRNPSEQRIVGTNLPWPFHPETAVSIPHKVPQFINPFLKPEAVSALGFECTSTGFSKEDASSSNPHQVQWRNSEVRLNERLKENGADDYSATRPLSNPKEPMATPRGFSLLQYQGGTENAARQSAGGSTEKTYYSFLPQMPADNGTDASKRVDGAEEGVDTSLKL